MDPRASRRMLLARILAAALGALVLLYAGRALVLPSAWHPWWDGVFYNGGLFLAAGTLAVRAAAAPRARAAWGTMSVGVALYAAGFVYWAVVVRPSPVYVTPTLGDALFIAIYPCLYAGLLLLVRDAGRVHHSGFVLDGLVAGSAVAASAAALVLAPLTTGGGTRPGPFGVGVTAAYAACDLVLLVLTVSVIVVMRFRVPPSWWLLAAGLLVLTVSDLVFFVMVSSSGDWKPGAPLLLPYLVALSAIALAAGWRERVPAANGAGHEWPVLIVPVVGLAAATILLLMAPRLRTSGVVETLAALTILLAAVRLLVTFAELRRLAASDRLSVTDELTGLDNRRGFYRHAAQHLATTPRCALVLIDLDNFKEVNDTLGHAAGDELLAAVAARLSRAARVSDQIRTADVMARLGGDEFAAILPNVGAGGGIEAARRLLGALQQPFVVQDVSLYVGASAGVVEAPVDGASVDVLLRKADVAMYTAKRRGGDLERYRLDIDTRSRSRLHLIDEIRTSLDERLRVHYQPKVCLRTGAVMGVEALVRLEEPSRGLLLPAAFLPLVADTSLSTQLTERVLDLALEQAKQWQREGHVVPVAVNVRADALHDELLLPLVGAALDRHHLDGSSLIVEVTEDFLMADRPTGRAVVEQLREMGVAVSIDDYGTGYSSLAYLRDLPVDELKLDRTFVADMTTDDRSRRIVHSTIELAHGLGMRLVAEGVETREVVTDLRRHECDQAQGYVFATPGPAADLAHVVRHGFRLADLTMTTH